MKTLIIVLSCAFGIGLPMSIDAQDALTIDGEVKRMQREVVARLSGESAIEEDVFLQQRASTSEREMVTDYLTRCLVSMGWNSSNHNYKIRNANLFLDLFFNPSKGVNISAVLPSTIDSDEYIIFGAHYDSERGSPGAIDNATGVALCLGLVHKLSELAVREKNFIVVFFDQEEDDEVGSGAYVQWLTKEKINVHSAHILDMMGWDENRNRAVAFQSKDEFLIGVYGDLADRYNIPYQVIGGGSSDNRRFEAVGFATIATFEEIGDSTPYIHQPGDTFDTVDFEYLASTTQLVFEVFKKLLL